MKKLIALCMGAIILLTAGKCGGKEDDETTPSKEKINLVNSIAGILQDKAFIQDLDEVINNSSFTDERKDGLKALYSEKKKGFAEGIFSIKDRNLTKVEAIESS